MRRVSGGGEVGDHRGGAAISPGGRAARLATIVGPYSGRIGAKTIDRLARPCYCTFINDATPPEGTRGPQGRSETEGGAARKSEFALSGARATGSAMQHLRVPERGAMLIEECRRPFGVVGTFR